jgi:hypothetical protein
MMGAGEAIRPDRRATARTSANAAWGRQCRAALAERALADIPKLLTLMDRVPVSPTFGCFDRGYWHYRVADFPCGMSQEFVLPLALAWQLDMPGNRFRGEPEMRRWVEAGIRFAVRSAHADGSCDDYYPHEHAVGASAFSLLAILDASEAIGLSGDREIDAFVKRRSRWLAESAESGRLSNHEALVTACLARMGERFGPEWEAPLHRRLSRLLGWQHPAEGWFDEYGGADPGYLSLTIGMLADIDRRRPDLALRPAISAAVDFLADFVHPDGTVGGEYASRGTVNFFPHGLEIAGAWLPRARAINDLALRPLVERREPCFSDDRIIGHHLWSWMLAWKEWSADRPGPIIPPQADRDFPAAGMTIRAARNARLYCSGSRGGAFRLYDGDRLVVADSGPSLRTRGGRIAMTSMAGSARRIESGRRLRIEGCMAWAGRPLLDPWRSIVLRLLMLLAGRFDPDRVRRALQRLLVTGRREAPYRFERTIELDDGALHVRDRIVPERGWAQVEQIGLGGFQTPMVTVTARVWQEDQFQPWIDWTPRIQDGDDSALEVDRSYALALDVPCAAGF